MSTKILLVEDDEMNGDMLSRRLQLKGYLVVQAFNGLQGLEMAATETPDFILMDMSLTHVGWLGGHAAVEGRRATRPIPVIALTAHALRGGSGQGIAGGMRRLQYKARRLAAATGEDRNPLERRGHYERAGGFIVLVDDEELNGDMLGRRLELHGYRVTPAETAGSRLTWSSTRRSTWSCST